jgi:penicillin-binding protein 1A
MKWARKPDPEVAYFEARVRKPSEVLKRGDVILVRLLKEGKSSNNWEVGLEQNPEAQGAILCIVPHTGEIKAMVGGKDFSASQFNRAVQSRRQPGSAFKPIIYSAALDWGMNPASVLIDAPYISYDTPDEKAWKPSNYKEKFFGPTLFRTGLAKSRNVITVKILKKIGIKYAIEYARRMGIESDLSPDLSLALGSSGLSLMELTRAYSIFANEGTMAKPIFINKIVDRRGEIIEENTTETKDVLSKQTAYVMTTLMQAVIKEGTGWRIRKLQRPCAGKTGTTNNLWDAWFMGYTPNLVTGVWVGYDDHRPMGKGETGSRAASPIWLDFMSKILEGKPIVDFAVPDGVLFAKIDGETGLLAGPYSKKTVFQAFVEGTEPKEYAPRPETPKLGGFFQYDMDDTN